MCSSRDCSHFATNAFHIVFVQWAIDIIIRNQAHGFLQTNKQKIINRSSYKLMLKSMRSSFEMYLNNKKKIELTKRFQGIGLSSILYCGNIDIAYPHFKEQHYENLE